MDEIVNNRFAVPGLLGKLANICADLSSTHLVSTSKFKSLTGGDRVKAEYKYRNAFDCEPYARFVFSANEPPRADDASYAFIRRWLVIPFERTFDPEEQVPRRELDARLSKPEELSGVLNKAIAVAKSVRDKGITETKSMQTALATFRSETDPIVNWLGLHVVQSREAYITKSELYTAYTRTIESVPMSMSAFGRALKRQLPNLTDGQRLVDGQTTWVWLGITLQEPWVA